MLIIAGQLKVDSEDRDQYVQDCRPAVEKARCAPGCFDFAVTADTLEPDRVNVYERWESDEKLHQFRGEGPEDDVLSHRIRDAHVWKFRGSETESP